MSMNNRESSEKVHIQHAQILFKIMRIAQKVTEMLRMWKTSARFATLLGEYADHQNNPEQAEQYFKKSVGLAGKKNIHAEMDALTTLDTHYCSRQLFEKRIPVLSRKIEIRSQTSDSLGLIQDLSEIGYTFLCRELPDRAVPYFERALRDCPPDASMQLQCDLRLHCASAYAAQGKLELAEELLKDACEKAKKAQLKTIEALVSHQLGMLLLQQSKTNQAEQLLTAALRIINGSKNEGLEALILEDLGDLYIQINKPQKAITTLDQALRRYTHIQNFARAVYCCQKMSQQYAAQDEYEKAFDLLGSMLKQCQIADEVEAVEAIQSQTKLILEQSEEQVTQEKGSELDEIVQDALLTEIHSNKQKPLEPNRTNGSHDMHSASAHEQSNQKDIPFKVYEYSDDYVQSVLKKRKKNKPEL